MALRALPRCWAHLAGVSGREKMYSGSIILLKHYCAIYLAIGGRDRMDCSGAHWMTCPINRTRHQSRRLVVRPRCWGRWAVFIAAIYVYLGSYIISLSILFFPMHQRRREWVDGTKTLVWFILS